MGIGIAESEGVLYPENCSLTKEHIEFAHANFDEICVVGSSRRNIWHVFSSTGNRPDQMSGNNRQP